MLIPWLGPSKIFGDLYHRSSSRCCYIDQMWALRTYIWYDMINIFSFSEPVSFGTFSLSLIIAYICHRQSTRLTVGQFSLHRIIRVRVVELHVLLEDQVSLSIWKQEMYQLKKKRRNQERSSSNPRPWDWAQPWPACPITSVRFSIHLYPSQCLISLYSARLPNQGHDI